MGEKVKKEKGQGSSVKSTATIHSNYTFDNQMDRMEASRENKRASDQAVSALKYAISIQKKRLGPHHSLIQSSLCALGKAHYRRREYSCAVEAYEACLRIRAGKRDSGMGVADVLNRIGNVKYHQAVEYMIHMPPILSAVRLKSSSPRKLLKDAMKRYQAALTIYKGLSTNGEETSISEKIQASNNDEAFVIENIGNVHFRMNQYDDALSHYNASINYWLSIQSSYKDVDNSTEITSILANTYTFVGDLYKVRGEKNKDDKYLQTALDYFKKALEMKTGCIKELGKSNAASLPLETAGLFDHIAEVNLLLDDIRESLIACDKAINIKSRELGKNHLYKSYSLFLRAKVQEANHTYDFAVGDLEEGLRIQLLRLRQREIDFAQVARKADNIVQNKVQQFSVITEESEYEKEMSDMVKAYFDVSKTYQSIARLQRMNGKFRKSLAASKSELKYLELYLGENNIEHAFVIEKIGLAEFKLLNFDQALVAFEKVLKLRKLKFGHNHIAIASAKNNIANVFNAQGNLPKALEMYQNALKDMQALRKNHPQTVSILDNLASIHAKTKSLTKAKELYSESLELKRMHLMESKDEEERCSLHNSIACSLKYIATIHYEQDNLDASIGAFEEALDEKTLSYKDNDPETAEILSYLGNIFYLSSEPASLKAVGKGNSKANLEKAQVYFEKALKLKKMNGSDKTDINNTQSIVSHIMKKLGHHEDARNLMKNALSG